MDPYLSRNGFFYLLQQRTYTTIIPKPCGYDFAASDPRADIGLLNECRAKNLPTARPFRLTQSFFPATGQPA
jgi:hypothetical protein